MKQYLIRGGNPLKGEVAINGAKNAALGIIAAAVMTDDPVTIENIPDVWDINVLIEAIEELGAYVERIDAHTVRIIGNVESYKVDNENMRHMRGSYYLLGALLGKYKKASVPHPGGCNIGSRPIEQHIKGFSALGANVSISHGMINADAEQLHGNHIYFDVVSVGATINIMLGAVLAEGQTIIENVAKEPHIVDVANFLNSMGANIKGAGTDVIKIKGVEKLHGSTYSIIPDQIEAGTFMIAAAATQGDVLVKNVIPKHLEALTAKLIEVGATVEEQGDCIRVAAHDRPGCTQIKTLVYPGFPTDLQPQMTLYLALGKEGSIITETIFENRFKYVDELFKMGADIKAEKNIAVTSRIDRLTGAKVCSPDLRAGAALVIAGLVAEGVTTVENVEFIERGYENFEIKLRELGADIVKVDSSDDNTIRRFGIREEIS